MGPRPPRRSLRRPPPVARRRGAWLAALCAAAIVLVGCDRAPGHAGSAASAEAQRLPASAATGTTADGSARRRFVAGAQAAGATLPDEILRGLSTDARVLDCGGGVVAGRSAFDAGWVVVHPVDLDADGRDDWLVEGRHRCLAGPDGADWWLYSGDTGTARLVAAAGRAHAVELLPGRHGGFHDLQLQAKQGDVTLRYAAGAYASVDPAAD